MHGATMKKKVYNYDLVTNGSDIPLEWAFEGL
jgi:hypothetical protein